MREMKDSGVEWIGEIPRNWRILRGKYVLHLLNRNVEEDSDVITCFRDGEVTLRTKRREEGFTFSLKEIGYQGIKKGDLVIHGMDGFAGAIGVSDSDGKGSPVLVVCDSNENKEYISYYLRALAYMDVFLSLSTGIRERSCDLGWKKISDLLFIIPPKEEQERITHLINDTCAQIDRAIARQQEVIERLKEYKLSVITEAVTKGLNPDVPMKDSGIEWIGEIPEHWGIASLGSLFDFLGGFAYSSESYVSDSSNQVVRMGNVKNDMLLLESNPVYISDELAGETSKYQLNPGNILFTMTGTKGKRDYFYTHLLNGLDFSNLNLFLNQRVGCLIPAQNVCAGYYNYLLKDSRILDSIFLYESGTANQGNLGIDSIRRTKLHNPSYSEQIQIQQYLDGLCKVIDTVVKKKVDIINKLTEYKKSLIYEVVTGKREV